MKMNANSPAPRAGSQNAASGSAARFPAGVINRVLFEDGPIGMAILSPSYRFVHVNRAFCRFLGYSKQELLGKTVRDVTHPGDWVATRMELLRLRAVARPISLYTKRYVHRDGHTLWGIVHARRVRDGKHSFAFAQIVDITEQKKMAETLQNSEARYRVALQGSPMVLFSQDRRLRYTWVHNPTRGFTLNGVLGKRDVDLLDQRDARILTRIKRQVLKSGKGRHDEVTTHPRSGDMVFDLTTEALRDEQGRINGIICGAVDITARKQMEQDLRESQAKLETRVKEGTDRLRVLANELLQAEQRERRRLADILHEDLQQHLVAMRYKVNTLKEHSTGEAVSHTADWLLSELDHTIQMTRTLTTELRPPILYELGLGAALEWLSDTMKAKFDFTFEVVGTRAFTLPSADMRMFAFDATRELLMNVIKHAGVKTAEVRLRRAGAHRATVEVRDSGVGFDPEHIAENKFGLFSIRERALALGSRLEITSSPGRGTRAVLTLPIL